MQPLLIVEDDRALNQGLCRALRDSQRQVLSCFDLKSAREQLACQPAALVLLDVNLPDGSGLCLLREIKAQHPELPVILLTANDTDPDIVEGLEQGADDYITKPFSLAVLRARVNTQLRRLEQRSPVLNLGPFCFDFLNLRFLVHGTPIELSKTEQKLLRLLVENRGAVLSRAALVDRLWTDSAEYVDENALSVTVKRLRDKLGAPECIRTVYGVGYRWEGPHE